MGPKVAVAGKKDQSNWVVPYTTEDAKYQQLKFAQGEELNFVAWLSQKYDMNDPAQREIMRKIYPEYFTQRSELLRSKAKLNLRYAEMRLNGASSKEDLLLEYMIETGQIKLDEQPIWKTKKGMVVKSSFIISQCIIELQMKII